MGQKILHTPVSQSQGACGIQNSAVSSRARIVPVKVCCPQDTDVIEALLSEEKGLLKDIASLVCRFGECKYMMEKRPLEKAQVRINYFGNIWGKRGPHKELVHLGSVVRKKKMKLTFLKQGS